MVLERKQYNSKMTIGVKIALYYKGKFVSFPLMMYAYQASIARKLETDERHDKMI